MANPLETGSMPPPAPQQDTPVQNSLQQGGPSQGAPQGQQAAPAPPTHEQTVAALRHFDAIKGELALLLDNPALGKSDLKGAVIDGTAKLVAERIISAATAVQQLSQVPSDPLQQRKYLTQMMQQTVQAENAVLDHYKQGNPSLGDIAGHVASNAGGNRDDHQDHMKALHANYAGNG